MIFIKFSCNYIPSKFLNSCCKLYLCLHPETKELMHASWSHPGSICQGVLHSQHVAASKREYSQAHSWTLFNNACRVWMTTTLLQPIKTPLLTLHKDALTTTKGWRWTGFIIDNNLSLFPSKDSMSYADPEHCLSPPPPPPHPPMSKHNPTHPSELFHLLLHVNRLQ